MNKIRFVVLLVGMTLVGVLTAADVSAAPEVIPVWPNLKLPTRTSLVKHSHVKHAAHSVLQPTLTLFPAPAKEANGCAMVICPGGGYRIVIVSTGYKLAHWFNKIGVSCYVLRYRLPDGKLPVSGVPWPLQDVRRAMQIVRANAAQWHIDPHRVGVMGESAGGSVASLAGVHWLPGDPTASDPLDRLSTRPDFMILCYPVISMMPGVAHNGSHKHLLGNGAPLDVDQYLSSELNVNALTPPAFICYAQDDHTVNHENEKLFYAALQRAGIPAKLVEFKHGGHGFGLGHKGTDSTQWPKECELWLKGLGFLNSSSR